MYYEGGAMETTNKRRRREAPRVPRAPAREVESGWYGVPSLRTARLRRNMSQAELSRLADVGQQTISRLEWGIHRAQARTVRRLAEALNAEISELLRKPLEETTMD